MEELVIFAKNIKINSEGTAEVVYNVTEIFRKINFYGALKYTILMI